MTTATSSPVRSLARATRDRIRDGHRHLVFSRAMHAFLRDPKAAAGDEELLSDLVYGWGNAAWSGAPELLKCCIEKALVARAPMLECGSGLTTLVIGAIAQRNGTELWSLEHLPEWAERVSAQLGKFGINAVHLCVSPLVELGEYHWYAAPPEVTSRAFGLVVCDGPPSSTPGGRYGLLPVMRQNLRKECVILLDDAEREDEQAIVRRWCDELHCACTQLGVIKPFFHLVVLEERCPRGAPEPLAN